MLDPKLETGKHSNSVWERCRRSKQPPLQNAGAFSTRINVCVVCTHEVSTSPEKLISNILRCFRWKDPCLDIPYPIRSAGSLQKSICQDPLQNSCARSMCRESLQDPCLRIPQKTSARAIHACGPAARCISLGPLQDPCLRIHAAVYTCAEDPCLSSLNCGSSTKSMPQDSLEDPCLRALYRIHVSGPM